MSNFTPRAQLAPALARKEASRLNHKTAGTGHLLLGIIRLQQGTALEVMSQMIVGGLEPLRIEVKS